MEYSVTSPFDGFPKDLLVALFDFVGLTNWHILTLVCKTWRDIIDSFKEVRYLHDGYIKGVFHLCRGVLHSPMINGVREPAAVINIYRQVGAQTLAWSPSARDRSFRLAVYLRYGVIHRGNDRPAAAYSEDISSDESTMMWVTDGNYRGTTYDKLTRIMTNKDVSKWATVVRTYRRRSFAEVYETAPVDSQKLLLHNCRCQYEYATAEWGAETDTIDKMVANYTNAPSITLDHARSLIPKYTSYIEQPDD